MHGFAAKASPLETLVERGDEQVEIVGHNTFQDIVVSAHLERRHRNARIARSSRVDDWRMVGNCHDVGKDIEPRLALQEMVENDRVDAAFGEPLQTSRSARRQVHNVTLAGKVLAQ